MPLIELADLTAGLPRGCALWRAVGGPMAETSEEFGLRVIAWRIAEQTAQQRAIAGDKKAKPPEPPVPIPYAHEIADRQRREAEKQERHLARRRARRRAKASDPQGTTTDT